MRSAHAQAFLTVRFVATGRRRYRDVDILVVCAKPAPMLVLFDPRDVDEKGYCRHVVQLERRVVLIVGAPAAGVIRAHLRRDVDLQAQRLPCGARSTEIEDSKACLLAHSAGGAAGAYSLRKPFTAVQ